MVLYTTSDNQNFRVDSDVAEHSIFIRDILESTIPADEDFAIYLPKNVTGPIFQKVLEYCEHHRHDPLPEDFTVLTSSDSYVPKRRTLEISEWDSNFMKGLDDNMLRTLTQAAFDLQFKSFFDVTCKTIADKMKGMTTEQIREFFNIVNDFTPEEEEQIRKENEWASDY